MMTVLSFIGWFLFGLAIAGGLVLDFVGLFGNWLIFGAMLSAWLFTGFKHFSILAILGLFVLAVVGELVEMAAASYGAGRFGGTRGAKVAAFVGCLIGAVAGTPWLPIIGTLAGACVGAFAAASAYEYFVEGRKPQIAFRVGTGAAIGKVAGIVAKVLVGIAMLFAAAITY